MLFFCFSFILRFFYEQIYWLSEIDRSHLCVYECWIAIVFGKCNGWFSFGGGGLLLFVSHVFKDTSQDSNGEWNGEANDEISWRFMHLLDNFLLSFDSSISLDPISFSIVLGFQCCFTDCVIFLCTGGTFTIFDGGFSFIVGLGSIG